MDKIDKILKRIDDKQKLKEAELKEVQSDYNLIDENRKIKQLKNEIKSDKWIQIKGWLILIYAFLGTIATTSISIAGGISEYTHTFIFGLGVVTIQSGLFLLTQNETTIKKKFPDFLTVVKLLQIGLLFLSVRFNYNFFNSGNSFNVFTLILCICFDVTILKAITISSDFRTLNYHSKKVDFNNMSFIKMILFNFTAKFRINTLRQFNYNKTQFSKLTEKKNTEELQEMEAEKQEVMENKEPSKLLLIRGNKNDDIDNEDINKDIDNENQDNTVVEKDKELITRAIFDNKTDDNICPSLAKLEKITGFSKTKISKVKKELANEGILTTSNFKTIVNLDSMDFIN